MGGLGQNENLEVGADELGSGAVVVVYAEKMLMTMDAMKLKSCLHSCSKTILGMAMKEKILLKKSAVCLYTHWVV